MTTANERTLSDRLKAVAAPVELTPETTQPGSEATKGAVPWMPLGIAIAAGVIIFAVTVVLPSSKPATSDQVLPTQQTSTFTSPTSAPTSVQEQVAPHVVPAFWSPNGTSAGDQDISQATPIARYEMGWVQMRLPGDGKVWVAAASVSGIDIAELPDLKPLPTAEPPPYVPVDQVQYDPPPPAATEAPAPTAVPVPESNSSGGAAKGETHTTDSSDDSNKGAKHKEP